MINYILVAYLLVFALPAVVELTLYYFKVSSFSRLQNSALVANKVVWGSLFSSIGMARVSRSYLDILRISLLASGSALVLATALAMFDMTAQDASLTPLQIFMVFSLGFALLKFKAEEMGALALDYTTLSRNLGFRLLALLLVFTGLALMELGVARMLGVVFFAISQVVLYMVLLKTELPRPHSLFENLLNASSRICLNALLGSLVIRSVGIASSAESLVWVVFVATCIELVFRTLDFLYPKAMGKVISRAEGAIIMALAVWVGVTVLI